MDIVVLIRDATVLVYVQYDHLPMELSHASAACVLIMSNLGGTCCVGPSQQ